MVERDYLKILEDIIEIEQDIIVLERREREVNSKCMK